MGDASVPSLLAGQAIGRWGNFTNREAFGDYTDGLLAMRLPITAVREKTFAVVDEYALPASRPAIGSILKYTIYIIGFVVALGCLGVDAAAMFVSAGVVGIVVGFGAQSLIEDVITGLFIIFEAEFEVGDIITIDGFRGEVKSIGLRTVSIIDRGGNIRIINNSEISSLINLSEVNSVAVVTVPVSYEDKLLDVEAAVKEALSELPSEYPEIFICN